MTGEQEEWETGKKSLSDCRVVLKGLGKAHGVSSSHSYLPKESHDVQEWAITSTLTAQSVSGSSPGEAWSFSECGSESRGVTGRTFG